MQAVRARNSLVLLLSLSAAGLGALERPVDPLWQRAVEVVAANMDWQAGTTELVIEERNGRGRVRRTYRVITRSTIGTDGERQDELLLYHENGKDVTEEKRAERVESNGDGSGSGNRGGVDILDLRNTPFHPDSQGAVSIDRLPHLEQVSGRWCAVFAFEQSLPDESSSAGTVWIDAESAAPVRLRAVPDSMPAMVKDILVEATYAYTPRGEWYTRGMRLEGSVVILFVRRGFLMDMSFDEHWRGSAADGPA